MEMKVQDYPHLRKRGAGVVNVDVASYDRARALRKNTIRMNHDRQRLSNVEQEVRSLTGKVDQILDLLHTLRA